ncbi:hypothetical protein [Paraburkholderia aspalathi]|uniref:Uncharacterized protein n=1 Tax=Paraburkholderia aspalathi TaxID=1324617 RepID=A0A1I7AA20_9BURK|nr:hypothetical protein [Paraburkholderia aspalathi]SFT71754.1 hypothetical protein SAMN05192563_1003208 [Paraburkholderia aspalathi]
MTPPPLPAWAPRRRLLPLAAALWLAVISFGVCMDHLALSHLARSTERSAPRTEVAALQRSQSDIVQQLAALKRQPEAVSRADLAIASQATDQRIAALEHAIDARASADEMTALQTRVSQVETTLIGARPKPSRSVAHRPAAHEPKAVTPPFALRGMELRGGEMFLSIAPATDAPLDQATLLRPGETTEGWQLESVDGHTATFRANGVSYPLSVPGTAP